ncbi:MAG: tail fiber protein [Bacteroidota bacterium]
MEPHFLGEIRLFGGNFAPRQWAFCEGQLLAISQNSALFSILGTTYGGDGRTTFGLPDLRARAAVSSGHGPGLDNRPLGQKTGNYQNVLNNNQLPPHNHVVQVTATANLGASSEDADTADPSGNSPAIAGGDFYASSPSAGEFLGAANLSNLSVTTGQTGNNQPVNNMMPSKGMRFIIALQGIYPSRS